jgi:hypothetical protein
LAAIRLTVRIFNGPIGVGPNIASAASQTEIPKG